jgi:hypothetical protein
MAGCRGVVSTAGFESVCEAIWLGKPLFLVPVEGHIEQLGNALEAVQLGYAIQDTAFVLDRLVELPSRLSNEAFRTWAGNASEVLARVLELATGSSPLGGPGESQREGAGPKRSSETAPARTRSHDVPGRGEGADP